MDLSYIWLKAFNGTIVPIYSTHGMSLPTCHSPLSLLFNLLRINLARIPRLEARSWQHEGNTNVLLYWWIEMNYFSINDGQTVTTKTTWQSKKWQLYEIQVYKAFLIQLLAQGLYCGGWFAHGISSLKLVQKSLHWSRKFCDCRLNTPQINEKGF